MLYTLYGENDNEMDKYINNIMESNNISNKIVYNYKEVNIKDIIEEAMYNDLFSTTKLVILNEADFLTGKSSLDNQDLINYINNPNDKTIFIFKVKNESLDERKKIVKLLKEKSKVVEFKLLNEKNIENYIINYFKEKNYNIKSDAVVEIKKRLVSTPNIIDNELIKLLIYKEKEKDITIKDVKEIITNYKEPNIFNLIDSVIKKDKYKIFSTYKELIDNKEEPSVIITLLANQFRLFYQVKVLEDRNMDKYKIASFLHEHPYRIELAINSSRNISKKEIKRIIKRLFITDFNIKKGIEEKYSALEQFFIEI